MAKKKPADKKGKASAKAAKKAKAAQKDERKEKKKVGKSKDNEEEDSEGMRVDFYLVVFLKFIASIVPTIEVDSTTSM